LARRGFVGHLQYDHTSILSMIEWRWGLAPLSVRDASANNIAHALDFERPGDLTAPRFSVPMGPFGDVCGAAALQSRTEFTGLRHLAQRHGFRLSTP